ncbi:MAG: hypothetical protein ACPGNT_03935 [Rhodospirillales bacterium]
MDLKLTPPAPDGANGSPNGSTQSGTAYDARSANGPEPRDHPVAGYMAVGFGLLGIFVSFIFVPAGFLMSIICMFRGQGIWALGGIILSVIGFLTSIVWMGLLGLGVMWGFLDFNDWMQPVFEIFDFMPGNGPTRSA